MQWQKENLTAQVSDTVAKQLALDEEAAALKLALGNITSSLHELAPTDASPSPDPDRTPLNRTYPSNSTTRVSPGSSTCYVTSQTRFVQFRAGQIADHFLPKHPSSFNSAQIQKQVFCVLVKSGKLTALFHLFHRLTFGKMRGTLSRHERGGSGSISCSWEYMSSKRTVINC